MLWLTWARWKDETKGTKPLLQLTWAGQYKKRLIIGFKQNKSQIFVQLYFPT